MSTPARTLIVFLLLLALPFQGMAAAAMRCAHGAAPVPVLQPAQPSCHGHAMKADRAAGIASDGQAASDTGAGKQQCSDCAACSVGAAMAPAVAPALPEAIPGGPCPAARPAPIAGAVLELPERPPRPILV